MEYLYFGLTIILAFSNCKYKQEIASHLSNGRLVHIEGTGHLIRLDKSEETERQIRAFLAGMK